MHGKSGMLAKIQNEIPCSFKSGLSHDGKVIRVLKSTIDKAYDEISKWRKNNFLVPYGRIGKDFIDKLTEHINDWSNGAEGHAACFTKSSYCTNGSWASKTK
jgi:hypothetical protein